MVAVVVLVGWMLKGLVEGRDAAKEVEVAAAWVT
jgi:hypothetical protein